MKLSARQIEVFLAVMETRTLIQAAERLMVSQPAVSRMLERFQDEAGFKVFEKRGTKLNATAAGEIFYTEVKRYYRGIEHLDVIAKELKTNRRGFLKVGVLSALSNDWIMSRIKGFVDGHDKIQVSIDQRSSRTLINLVSAQVLDVAIVSIYSDAADLECTKLEAYPGVCLLPPHHKLIEKKVVNVHDLAGEMFVSLSEIDGSKMLIDRLFDEHNISVDSKVLVSQGSSACYAVSQGLGITIVPNYIAQEYSHLDFEIRPFAPLIEFSTYLLKANHRPYSALIDSFMEHMNNKI